MNIEGDKVILREMREQDKEMLLNLIKDSETEKVTGGYSSPVSYDHQMDWFRSQSDSARSLRCVVANKEKIQYDGERSFYYESKSGKTARSQ